MRRVTRTTTTTVKGPRRADQDARNYSNRTEVDLGKSGAKVGVGVGVGVGIRNIQASTSNSELTQCPPMQKKATVADSASSSVWPMAQPSSSTTERRSSRFPRQRCKLRWPGLAAAGEQTQGTSSARSPSRRRSGWSRSGMRTPSAARRGPRPGSGLTSVGTNGCTPRRPCPRGPASSPHGAGKSRRLPRGISKTKRLVARKSTLGKGEEHLRLLLLLPLLLPLAELLLLLVLPLQQHQPGKVLLRLLPGGGVELAQLPEEFRRRRHDGVRVFKQPCVTAVTASN